MADTFKLEVKGIKQVKAALKAYRLYLEQELFRYAGADIRDLILKPRGGGKAFYPHETPANHPPTPYYERGLGTVYKQGWDNSSKQMDQHFYMRNTAKAIYIGNKGVKYAPYVISEVSQTPHMRNLGWRTLWEVAMQHSKEIVAILQKYVNKAIKDKFRKRP